MLQAPQVKPISRLRTHHMDVMRLLPNGPVFLAQRGTLAAAILSIEEWNKIATELARLRRIIAADKQFAEMDAGNVVEFNITQAPA